jgi:hypothetical protein
MDWSHTKKRGWGNTKGCLTMEPSRKQEVKKTEEQVEKIGYQRGGENVE